MQVEIAVDLVDQDDGETQETVLEPVPDLDDSGLTNNTAAPAAMLQEKAETRRELFTVEIFTVEYFIVEICFLLITWVSFLQ